MHIRTRLEARGWRLTDPLAMTLMVQILMRIRILPLRGWTPQLRPLLYVIKKQGVPQVLDGRRQRELRFTPAAVTMFDELGPGCTMVQEWLASRLKGHLEKCWRAT